MYINLRYFANTSIIFFGNSMYINLRYFTNTPTIFFGNSMYINLSHFTNSLGIFLNTFRIFGKNLMINGKKAAITIPTGPAADNAVDAAAIPPAIAASFLLPPAAKVSTAAVPPAIADCAPNCFPPGFILSIDFCNFSLLLGAPSGCSALFGPFLSNI